MNILVRERREWFKGRFGSAFRRYEGIIPERCHAETSFGFLVAYEEDADVVLELDDACMRICVSS